MGIGDHLRQPEPRIADDDQRSSLAVAQAFIRNQGDAWRWTLDQFNRALEELSRTPLLGLVVTNTAQGLHCDGYRNPNESQDAAGWRTWQANDLGFRQAAIHRAGLSHGLAYATVLPGMDADGPRSVIRGVSARKMLTVYADPAEDDWPMYALRREASGGSLLWRLYDDRGRATADVMSAAG